MIKIFYSKFKKLINLKLLLHLIRERIKNYQYSHIKPINTIIKTYEGVVGDIKRKRICLFAHFDPHGIIDDYVIHYLDQIKKNNFKIILISTSHKLHVKSMEKALEKVDFIIHRKNIGLDFGSWKTAMDYMSDLFTYDELLLANDSAFGPFEDLSICFDRFAQMNESICGLTDNWEYSHHLQSYFLYFKKEAFHSECFKQFWDNCIFKSDKDDLILNYEIGLSSLFLKNQFTLGSYVNYEKIYKHCLSLGRENFQFYDTILMKAHNPTLFMWYILMRDFKFPFLKTDVLKRNVMSCNKVKHWRKYLLKESKLNPDIITKYIYRTTLKEI